MAAISLCRDLNCSTLQKSGLIPLVSSSAPPIHELRVRPAKCSIKERVIPQRFFSRGASLRKASCGFIIKKEHSIIPRCSDNSNSIGGKDESPGQEKTPFFGYTRKDVLLIGLGVTIDILLTGLGVTLAGIGLKSGFEFVGVDPLQAGNVFLLVLLVSVLGLAVGWISTYIVRVLDEMRYAQQLSDYEDKIKERLESLKDAELGAEEAKLVAMIELVPSLTDAEIVALFKEVLEKKLVPGGEQRVK